MPTTTPEVDARLPRTDQEVEAQVRERSTWQHELGPREPRLEARGQGLTIKHGMGRLRR